MTGRRGRIGLGLGEWYLCNMPHRFLSVYCVSCICNLQYLLGIFFMPILTYLAWFCSISKVYVRLWLMHKIQSVKFRISLFVKLRDSQEQRNNVLQTFYEMCVCGIYYTLLRGSEINRKNVGYQFRQLVQVASQLLQVQQPNLNWSKLYFYSIPV